MKISRCPSVWIAVSVAATLATTLGAVASATPPPQLSRALHQLLQKLDRVDTALPGFRIATSPLVSACDAAENLPAAARDPAQRAIEATAAFLRRRINRNVHVPTRDVWNTADSQRNRYARLLTTAAERQRLKDVLVAIRMSATSFHQAGADLDDSAAASGQRGCRAARGLLKQYEHALARGERLLADAKGRTAAL